MAGPGSEAMDLERLTAAVSQPEPLQCCCGKTDCVFLRHNCLVLDSVEKDVHTAAKLGQALLARHEAYMASAERERFGMQTRIEQLENEKKSLEVENARTIHENRALLDKLEALNNSVADSETHIKSLEATLQIRQQTIRKLEGAEARATQVESQITVLEAEQAALHGTLVTTEAEARTAMQRWRTAERGLSELQEKLERMERESREERQRHTEVVGRMERQRALEKDLNTAAGRLKGAAAAKTISDGKNGTPVISHFVRDLLQDNANLQLGIAELREMLMNSNDEIQHLRELLMFHQPADEEGEPSVASTLRAELELDEMVPKSPKSPTSPLTPQPTTSASQELHIHHHYHVSRPAEPKKPKKKRQGLVANIFTTPKPFSPSSPPSPGTAHWRLQHASTTPHVPHSVRDSISTAPSNRWSVFSEQPSDFAASSAPSSPVSNYRRSSLFDRGGYESPVSPVTSVDPASPAWTRHTKKPSDISTRKFSTSRSLLLDNLPENNTCQDPTPSGMQKTPRYPDIGVSGINASEDIHDVTAVSAESTEVSTNSGGTVPSMRLTPSFDDSFPSPRSHLRRGSRDSVISLTGGLDIHTLKNHPSQLALRPLGAASADTGLSTVIARPTIARGTTQGKRGSVVLRDNLLSLPNIPPRGDRATSNPVSSAPHAAPNDGQRSVSSSGISKLVGWRPWASVRSNQDNDISTTSSDRSRSLSPNTAASTSSPGTSILETASARSNDTPIATRGKKRPAKEAAFSPRNFGINQTGAIPGFQEYWAAHQRKGPPTKVVPDVVDTEALREGLAE